MNFRKAGFVLDIEDHPIHLVLGFETVIQYPERFLYTINEQYPSLIKSFVHTNPAGNIELSDRDKVVLKEWTLQFLPNPISMDILCKYKDGLYCYRSYKYVSGLEDNPWLMADVVSKSLRDWQERLIRFSYV